MDAISVVKRDHRAIERAYRHYQHAEDESDKAKYAQEICQVLEAHARMEESILYPTLQRFGGEEVVSEARIGHEEIRILVIEAQNLLVGPELDEALERLMGAVAAHVDEEERDLLPEAESDLSDATLEALGARMEILSPSAGHELDGSEKSDIRDARHQTPRAPTARDEHSGSGILTGVVQAVRTVRPLRSAMSPKKTRRSSAGSVKNKRSSRSSVTKTKKRATDKKSSR